MMQSKIQTAVTDILGIERPIIQGAMQWAANARLAAAVSAAGGLGIISAASFPDEDSFQRELRTAKALTDKPFAINLLISSSLSAPNYRRYLQIAAEEGVKIVETAGNAPTEFIQFIKDSGMIAMHKCTTVRHALKAEQIGCDIVVIDGCECGGHPGENDIGSTVLIPRTVEALKIPVVACGGFSTGRGLAAALMLGAEAVMMGTRFLVTQESPILTSVKEYIVGHITEMDTMLVLRSYKDTFRVYANDIAKEIAGLEKTGAPHESVAHLSSGTRIYKMLFETGDIQSGLLPLGQSAGLVHDVPAVKDLMDRLVVEALAIIGKYSGR